MNPKLKDVQLIALDMDGTLLNEHHEVSPLFFKQFDELRALGVEFLFASGRQHGSIVEKIQPVWDQAYIAGENGSVLRHGNETLLHIPLFKENDDPKLAEILGIVTELEDVRIILCTADKAYALHNDPNFRIEIGRYYANHVYATSIEEVQGQILKVALYHPDDAEQYVLPYLPEPNDYQQKVSGKNWIDLGPLAAHKGVALAGVQRRLNIPPSQTMAFGDYLNDVELLKGAYFSYAMADAHPTLKEYALCVAGSHKERGVERELATLLREMK